ncbi:MAG: potassium channel protein [bacterium]|nr:potassium channel protein [bacterium]
MPHSESTTLKNRIILSIILLFFTVTAGTSGYLFIEGWNIFDSFYMTVITLSTVGYQEVHPLSNEGKVFTIFLIFSGLGTVAYVLNYTIRFVLEGEIQEILGRRKMIKRIKELHDHYIVCGYGRMGRIICSELKSNKIPFLVVETEEIELNADDDLMIIHGDATRDDNLKTAGIERAKGLVSVLPSDAQNLYVVLSARGLNSKLQIVARASEDGAEQKLLRAGASKVVSPYHIGGIRIAHSILKPSIVDFIEFATMSGNLELQMEEIPIQRASGLSGIALDKTDIGKKLGVIIVAIKRGEEMMFNPTGKTVIGPEDTLIALGEASKLRMLEAMAKKY